MLARSLDLFRRLNALIYPQNGQLEVKFSAAEEKRWIFAVISPIIGRRTAWLIAWPRKTLDE